MKMSYSYPGIRLAMAVIHNDKFRKLLNASQLMIEIHNVSFSWTEIGRIISEFKYGIWY